MTKEQAFERLELPVGSDLQAVRAKFISMHNDYRMQIDNAFNPTSKHIFEQKLEELKEAYAMLNESEGIDDNASLPRTAESFEQIGVNQHLEIEEELSIVQALAIFGLDISYNDDVIVTSIRTQIEDLKRQLDSATLPAVRNVYTEEIDRLEHAEEIVRKWLETKESEKNIVSENDREGYQQEEEVIENRPAGQNKPSKKSNIIWITIIFVSIFFVGTYFFFLKPDEPAINNGSETVVNLSAVQDSAAWKAAVAANNEAAYVYYLQQFPSGLFKNEAETNISSLKGKSKEKVVEPIKIEVKTEKESDKKESKKEIVPVIVEEVNNKSIPNLAKRIRFKYDSSVIEPLSILDEIASVMLQDPDKTFQIMVFSDEGKSSDYEDKIATQRGKSIKNYLVNKGVASSSLSIYSFGNTRSVCKEATTSCYNKNNRVEIEEF